MSNFFYGTYPIFVFVRFSKVSWDDPIWMFLYEHERIIFDYVQINFFNTQFLSTALSQIDHPWNCLSSSIFLCSMSMALFSLIIRKCSSVFSGQWNWGPGIRGPLDQSSQKFKNFQILAGYGSWIHDEEDHSSNTTNHGPWISDSIFWVYDLKKVFLRFWILNSDFSILEILENVFQ